MNQIRDFCFGNASNLEKNNAGLYFRFMVQIRNNSQFYLSIHKLYGHIVVEAPILIIKTFKLNLGLCMVPILL